MFTYENGVILGFFFFIYDIVRLIIFKNSILEKNLNKIGMRLSWTSLSPKPIEIDNTINPIFAKILKSIFLILLSAIGIFLSWINIAFRLVVLIYHFSKNAGAPQIIKEYRWKMRNLDMSFDQIVKEGLIVEGIDLSKFDEHKELVLNGMRERGLL